MSKRKGTKKTPHTTQVQPSATRSGVWRHSMIFLSLLAVVALGTTVFFVQKGREIVYHSEQSMPDSVNTVAQFPVSVDPSRKEIIESTDADAFFVEHIAPESTLSQGGHSWVRRAIGKLALMSWYQNLASLSSRILVIQPGERKEQVAEHFGKILGWTNEEKQDFLERIESTAPELTDGKFYPGTYTVPKDSKPDTVAPLITDRFYNEVLIRYGPEVESKVPLHDALIIASLLEREAYDFTDMRQISGVIWNRLFTDMRLQIDATLQYAKGSKPKQPWWPVVQPADKYIASVYNTYKNEGLPPTPIANPSLEAILAALNPVKTDCMYYFHDRKAGFHCTETYEEHVAELKKYYGRGK